VGLYLGRRGPGRAVCLGGLLRYLLARRAIDKQAELQKARLELEFKHQVNLSEPQLEYKPEKPAALVTYEKNAPVVEDVPPDGATENG
jgi:hypothetical protein